MVAPKLKIKTMKFTTNIIILLFPFCLFGQDCDYFPIDTATVCGYEYKLDFALVEGTLSYGCENEQYLSISYTVQETNLAFSSCGTYELFYSATDGSCVDTLLIQISDPNASSISKNTDIGLDYGDIDCPDDVTIPCFASGVSIPIDSGTPTPIWSFCSTITCQTSIYTSDTLGLVTECLADSIVIDTFSTFSSSDYCSDTMQNAFIVLNNEGDIVTNNTFLDYLAQLQDTTNLDCFFPGTECSFTNTSTCHDSMVMDTTILPIPVRIGGQWTMPMIDTLQLFDTTYFTYFSKDYELILNPGVDFYGPGNLNVELNEIYISNSNDTTRNAPNDFYLELQWEEEWIIDTILLINEKYFDTDDDCFACGGFSSGDGFNVPGIPDFPCGPVGIYFPSLCECEYNEPDYAIQQIQCQPRMWQFELLSADHFISFVSGANADISQNVAILSNPSSQFIDIESFDIYGCSYYSSVYLDDYINDYYINSTGDLSCETEYTTLQAFGSYQFSSNSTDVSNTVWSNQQIGSNIIVTSEGTYTASFTDNDGCVYINSIYVGYDNTIDCAVENPMAETECNMSEFDIICDIMTFESFDYIMPSQTSDGNQPQELCDGEGTADNISWFSFVAYGGDYSINIAPSNCSFSNQGQQGIQVGLYSDCSFSNSAFCTEDCTVQDVSIPSQDLVEGQVYYMFIDGCQGSICNYEMELQGNPELPNLAPESMTLSSNNDYIQNANTTGIQGYCIGADVNCSLEGIEIEGEYLWSINTLEGELYSGESSPRTKNNNLWLNFTTEGMYEVCIDEIRNGCDQFTWSEQMCFSVLIEKQMDEIEIICANQGTNSLVLEWNELDDAEGYIIKIGNHPPVTVTANKYSTDQLEENTEYNIEISVITDHKCPSPTAFSSCKTKECVSLEFTYDIPEIICITDDMEPIEMKTTIPGFSEGFTLSGDNINGNLFDPNGLAAGVYQFEVTHQIEGCISNDMIEIEVIAPPEFDMIYDEKVCFGEESTSLEFLVSSDEYTILIDGEASEKTTEITPGMHEIVVMNSELCASYGSIFIEVFEETIFNIDGEIEIKEGEESTYSIDQPIYSELDLATITWTINGSEYCSGPECLSISPSLDIDSEIEITAINQDGCEVYSSVRILVEELEANLIIPNIFSPNNDGVNDYWFAMPNKDDIIIKTVKILDRWNNLVYSQNNNASSSNMKWDGKMNGTNLQPGVYVYAISYSSNENVETVYGDVTIIK